MAPRDPGQGGPSGTFQSHQEAKQVRDFSPHAILCSPLSTDEDVWWLIYNSRNFSYGLPVILIIDPVDELPEEGECGWSDEWRKKLH